MTKIKNILLALLLVVCLSLTVACGKEKEPEKEEKTELEIALESKIDNPTSYSITSMVRQGSTIIHMEGATYTKEGTGYKAAGSIKTLNALDAEEEYTITEIDEIIENPKFFEIKKEYFKDMAEVEFEEGDTIGAELSEEGTKALAQEGATDAVIVIKVADGKITSTIIRYMMGTQQVFVTAAYNY